MQILKPIQMRILAVSEWALVLPASVLLAAAAARLLQPRLYQPARTAWIILEWTVAHISRSGAAVLFLVLPSLAVVMGCSVLASAWRNDLQFREDISQALAALRRHFASAMLTAATALAMLIVSFVVVHIITD